MERQTSGDLIELQPISQCFFIEGAGAGRRNQDKNFNESLVALWNLTVSVCEDTKVSFSLVTEFLRMTALTHIGSY